MRYLLITLLIFYTTHLYSGVGSIIGNVFDRDSIPLAGTNITISGSTLGAESNQNGFYYIEPVEEGLYHIKAQFVGYKPKNRIVIVKADEKSRINFFLDEDDLTLPEAVLTAEKDIIDPKYKELIFKGVYYRQKPKQVYLFKRKAPDRDEVDSSVGFFEKLYYNVWALFN